MTQANVCPSEAANTPWDVLVVGAGPAGAIAARQTARSGHRTLLVDKQAFPRTKVCGACVNSQAMEVLQLLELGPSVEELPSVTLDALALHCGPYQATLRLPPGKAIARLDFDDALVRQAKKAGAKWLPDTTATVGGLSDNETLRVVELAGAGRKPGHIAHAQIVLVADGLGGLSILRRGDEFSAETSPASRVGVGGVFPEPPPDYAAGTIHMAVSRHGYVGLVRLHDGSLNIAAALDAAFLKEYSEVHRAVTSILSDARLPSLDLHNVIWKGTPPLTRRVTRPVSTRVLVLGDAASYEEPFTGEGMAWAITSGAAAAQLVPQGLSNWTPEVEIEWLEVSRRLIGQQQFICRLLAKTLRSYRLTAAVTRLLSAFPILAAPLAARSRTLPRHSERFLRNSVHGKLTRRPTHDQLASAATSTKGGSTR